MLHALTASPLDAGTAHFQASTLQISTIDIGNLASNVIPAEARAVFNIRFNDAWSSDSLRAGSSNGSTRRAAGTISPSASAASRS